MKITSGDFKGRNLLVPERGVKPTSEKVRQAVISILRPYLSGASMLDLYCGTGAVGIEALSNGAAACCFIDHTYKMMSILKKNLENIVGDPSRTRVIKHNASTLAEAFANDPAPPEFDIVFADPFYDDTRYVFERIHEGVFLFLKPGGIFIIEHGEKLDLSGYPGFSESRHYGDTYLSLFIKDPKAGTGGINI
jgi:16S rRNA (guanine966-N2)-methyltransferase